MTGVTDQRHRIAVEELRSQYNALGPGATGSAAPAGSGGSGAAGTTASVRLAKPTSNLFRFTDQRAPRRGLDVSAFGRVLEVDAAKRTARVQGMTTHEDLVDVTLRHDLMPLVVPELKTITLGGAVTGLGIESTSLRNGMPHEAVTEMEIMTGDGRVVTATPDNEHAALFRGFPNSYGTLGYALSFTIELEPVKRYVRLRHVPFSSPEACMEAIGQIAADGTFEGAAADFVDGVIFAPDELYLTIGSYSDVAPWLSDYTGQQIYYRSVRQFREDFLTIRDYLWRWDTDWFWCSTPFGMQNSKIRRLWPRRYRRSDVYRKLVSLDRRYGLTDQMNRSRQAPPKEAVIQDVEIPLGQCSDFLAFFFRDVGMSPVWMCPLRLRSSDPWPLYPLEPGQVYVNFGFWGTVPLPPGRADGYRNRLLEDAVGRLGGHKSLYSTAYYSREEFWRLYNGTAYAELKRAYDPDGRLLDLYDKVVRPR